MSLHGSGTAEDRKPALLYDFDGENEEYEPCLRRIGEHLWTGFRRQFRVILELKEKNACVCIGTL